MGNHRRHNPFGYSDSALGSQQRRAFPVTTTSLSLFVLSLSNSLIFQSGLRPPPKKIPQIPIEEESEKRNVYNNYLVAENTFEL